jgi:hypothetical protein
MIFDLQNLFSDKQLIDATTNSTNVIDMGVAGTIPGGFKTAYGTALRDYGRGQPVNVICQVTTVFATSTSVRVQLVASAATNLGTPTSLGDSGVIAIASLVPGYQFRIGGVIPPGATLRYLGLIYTVAGSTGTGNITAGLLFDRADSNYAPL